MRRSWTWHRSTPPALNREFEDKLALTVIRRGASDLFLPASGTVTEFNAALDSAPELVNKDPYGEGWIIKVSLSKPEELDTLLSPAQYREMIGA